MSLYKINETGDLKYISFDLLEGSGVVIHAFTTRHGGISDGPFDTLNLGMHVGDRLEAVLENRNRVCTALGFKIEDMVCGQQVHGDGVHVVTGTDRGRGVYDEEQAIPDADALITDRPGLLLSSYYADCVPIMVLDPVKRAIGLIHAGWKGTVLKIAAKALKTMEKTYGTNPADCLAVVAPSIGPCCYEVDSPVIDAAKRGGFDVRLYARSTAPDRWKLDLPRMNRDVLTASGLNPGAVVVAGLCTSCHPELFFSYRGQSGRCGRMASLMALK